MDLYYNGFCNGVLWQLFHYVPVQNDFKLSETRTLEQQWHAYVEANELFAEATLNDYRCAAASQCMEGSAHACVEANELFAEATLNDYRCAAASQCMEEGMEGSAHAYVDANELFAQATLSDYRCAPLSHSALSH